MSRLRVPEQDQIIDVEDQGSGARGRLGHSVLRIFKAQKQRVGDDRGAGTS